MSTSTASPANAPPAAQGGRRRHTGFVPLRVAAVDRLTDDAVAITFAVPPELAEDYRFTQGQHLNLRCAIDGEEVRRSYSICAPASSGTLRVAVKRLEGGAFSAYANSGLRPGDVIDVMPPTGRFFVPLDPDNDKHYAAVAAGSGITPILSILATTLEVEPKSRFTLVYGNRTTSSILFLEELADLKDRYPARLQIVHVLSRERQESDLLTGRIDAAKLRALLAGLVDARTVDEWFLCGPYLLVESAREVLAGAGVPASQVHAELFHVEGEPPGERDARLDEAASSTVSGRSSISVVLDGRATTVEMTRSGESVLEAVLRMRNDAPYACKGGVCGTCRAKVVEGEVRMDRNFALEPAEVQAGFVLACQSHPLTTSVALDFDA